jgi:uncharacterized protein (DUF1499 family)
LNRKDINAVEPLRFEEDAITAWKRLLLIVTDEYRSSIFTHDYPYLHVEYRSAVLKFVDDVEFLLEEDQQLIQLRSAARFGFYDFGVNRRRLKRITEKFYSGAPSAM